jgi:hypothetical protein
MRTISAHTLWVSAQILEDTGDPIAPVYRRRAYSVWLDATSEALKRGRLDGAAGLRRQRPRLRLDWV